MMKIRYASALTALLLISAYASSVSAQGFEHLTGWQSMDQDATGRYNKFVIFNDGNTSATIDMFGFYMPDGSMQWVDVSDFVLVINESKEIEVAQEYRDALRIVVLTTRGNTWPIKMRPTADFTYSRIGENASLTDNSSDKDGWIKSWSWNFGDSSTSTVQNPTHTFPNSNSYTVTLTVTDDDGLTGTVSKVIEENDFGASVDPTSGSVTQGSSASATITVSQTGSFNSSVSLSASGLPSGASASFSPSSGTPAFSSTMTVSTASATPTGTYTITITGSSAGVTRTADYTLTVSGGGGGGGGGGNEPYTLFVYVKDSNTSVPISGASVTIKDIEGWEIWGDVSGTTDSAGYVSWSSSVSYSPNQDVYPKVSKSGYENGQGTIHIENERRYGTTVYLFPPAPPDPDFTISSSTANLTFETMKIGTGEYDPPYPQYQTVTITVTKNAWDGDVDMSVSVSGGTYHPDDISASLADSVVHTGSSTTLTVEWYPIDTQQSYIDHPDDSYTITVTGSTESPYYWRAALINVSTSFTTYL